MNDAQAPVKAMATLAQLQATTAAPREYPAVRAGFFDFASFELIQRVAKGFASSTLVPKDYQGNLANCMIALNLAQRIGGDPLMVMQNLVIVHGKPTWSAQFLIASANMCGRFTAIRFEFFGDKTKDDYGCRAVATEKGTGAVLVGSDVTIAIAKKEGWFGKNGSKWQSMPQQMLMYRAGSWWVRAYAPELSMGLQTADEAIDTFNAEAGADGAFTVTTEDLQRHVVTAESDKNEAAAPAVVVEPKTRQRKPEPSTPPAAATPADQPLPATQAPPVAPIDDDPGADAPF